MCLVERPVGSRLELFIGYMHQFSLSFTINSWWLPLVWHPPMLFNLKSQPSIERGRVLPFYRLALCLSPPKLNAKKEIGCSFFWVERHQAMILNENSERESKSSYKKQKTEQKYVSYSPLVLIPTPNSSKLLVSWTAILPPDITIVSLYCMADIVLSQWIMVLGVWFDSTLCLEDENNALFKVWKRSWILHSKMCTDPV